MNSAEFAVLKRNSPKAKNTWKSVKMNKEKKPEETRISNYEILCIMRDCTPKQKSDLVERIKESVLAESLTVASEVRKLAYSIEKIKAAEYLLLNFKADRKRINEIEETLKNPLVVRHMTVNLDTEKKIKIKNSSKLQKNRKPRKPGPKAENSSQEKHSGGINQESEKQLGVSN